MVKKIKERDWFEEALACEDPTVQELLISYQTEESQETKETIKETIIKSLDELEEKKEPEENKEIKEGNKPNSLIMTGKTTEDFLKICNETPFEYTEKDVENTEDEDKLREIFAASRKKAEEIEKNRKIKEQTFERKARNQLIFRIKVIGNKARHKIELQKRERNEEIKKEQKNAFDVKRKRAAFIEYVEYHYSLDNIVKFYLKKNEIVEIVEGDPEVLKQCDRIQKGFIQLWQKWKEKNSL